MLASQVTIKELNSYEDCDQAIDKIKRDYRNVVGGLKAWNSGYTVHFTKTAQDKIAAIERRQDTFVPDDDE